MILSGVMQKSDTRNGNGRIYPHNVLMREMKNYQKLVKERRALGELDHPDDSVINLKNASHMITEVWWDGNAVMGKAKVLDTPSGKILRALVDSGVTLGISSRGMGSVETMNENGAQEVQDDFELIAFDFVSNPSTHGAFLHPMNESVENIAVRDTKYGKVEAVINDIMRG